MGKLSELLQSADWKAEKHVPALEAPERVAKGAKFQMTAAVGKSIPHPNQTAHHIAWVELYFHPQGEKFPYQIGRAEFSAHGASAQGPDTSTVYTQPELTMTMQTDKPGTIYAVSYCTIHGLWQSARELQLA